MVLVSSGEHSSPSPQAAIILRITDQSLYTVIFDDGDRRSLKRTQLVLKGERHFKESESLDGLPLTNPEQFKQPVIDRSRKYRNSSSSSTDEENEDEEESYVEDEEEEEDAVERDSDDDEATLAESGSDAGCDTKSARNARASRGETSASTSGLNLSNTSESGASNSRRRFTPGLVVLPSAMPSIDLKAAHLSVHEPVFLVRSFRENRL
ncbi:unnamed protein product [Dibothriocephalus latus]|uniref:Tudor domain-containing protein n=1 Tax=Dibothriocephalus latus TaxID=60516 RepID=A0A3P7MI92_DIBLA|nr:unnamed protein product [Dibothriocephalus latus]